MLGEYWAAIERMLSLGSWNEIIIALGIFLFFLFSRKLIVRFGFSVIRQACKKARVSIDNAILQEFEKPLRWLLVIFGVYLSAVYLPLTPYQDFLMTKFFRTAFIILIVWGFYKVSGPFLFEELSKKMEIEIDRILIPFLTKVVKFIIIALALTIIAQEWGYDVTGFIAGLGIGGLAVALAAKDAIANVFGGIIIITEKPFSIGDWIYTPSVEGTVEDISFRSTKVRTFAKALVTVPNSTLANEAITNWTKMGKRRVTFHLGVTYTTPVDKLRSCVERIRELLEKHPEVDKETIFVRFDNFNDSSLDIFIYFFTITTVWGEFLEVKEDINFKIMEILEEEGVSVAFPSRSIYLETPLRYQYDGSAEGVETQADED